MRQKIYLAKSKLTSEKYLILQMIFQGITKTSESGFIAKLSILRDFIDQTKGDKLKLSDIIGTFNRTIQGSFKEKHLILSNLK